MKTNKWSCVILLSLLAVACCHAQTVTNVTALATNLVGQTVALSGTVASVAGGGFGGAADKFTVRLTTGADVVIPAAVLRPGNVLAVIRNGGMSGENIIALVGPHKWGQVVKGPMLVGPGTRLIVTGVVRAEGNRAVLTAETFKMK